MRSADVGSPTRGTGDPVVVSRASVESGALGDVVGSNLSFVVALQREHFREDEISEEALLSLYVWQYDAEVKNGGLWQFIHNTRWSPTAVAHVREGLRAMGALRHAELFERSAAIVDAVGIEKLDALMDDEDVVGAADRDTLDAHDDAFYALSREEDLEALNGAWLRGRPTLRVLTVDEMDAEVARRADAMPDRAARVAAARAGEPRSVGTIRALCAAHGHELLGLGVVKPIVRPGLRARLAWHFRTDRGRFYMIESDGRAVMFDVTNDAQIGDIQTTR